MSNTRLIDNYKKEVKLIEAILSNVNVTQADRVSRIYDHAFVARVFSDQDFFEAINWYAKKVINVASQMSLRASRRFNFDIVRYWNNVIIAVVPLLGDQSSMSVDDILQIVDIMMSGRS